MPNQSVALKIHHNPGCGTSRNALELIRTAGIEPEIIEYLETPPDAGTLIVVTPWAARLCRPSEKVLDILSPPQSGP